MPRTRPAGCCCSSSSRNCSRNRTSRCCRWAWSWGTRDTFCRSRRSCSRRSPRTFRTPPADCSCSSCTLRCTTPPPTLHINHVQSSIHDWEIENFLFFLSRSRIPEIQSLGSCYFQHEKVTCAAGNRQRCECTTNEKQGHCNNGQHAQFPTGHVANTNLLQVTQR